MTAPPSNPQHPPTSRLGTEQAAKDAIAAWVRSPEMRAGFKLDPPVWRWVFAGALALTVVAIPAALGIFIGSMILWSRRKRAYADFLARVDRAQPLWVYPLMVNTMLRRERGNTAAGIVIGTFARGVDHEYFGHLAQLIHLLVEGPADTAEARFARDLFEQEEYVEGRRRRLPASITGDVPVYAFDLMIDSTHLPQQRVAGAIIPCIAEPGDTGFIANVPFSLMGTPIDWLFMTDWSSQAGDARDGRPA